MAPRSAEAMPAMTRPITNVGNAPRRAMKSDPGSAAIANRTVGRPERRPTWVPDRRRSDWMSAMTGGTARTLSRRLTPASHSRLPAIQIFRMALPAAAFFQRIMRGQKRVEDARKRAYAPRIHLLRTSTSCKAGWIAGSSPAMTDPSLRRAFETRERFVDLCPARFGLLALLALAFDHILRSAGDEIGIGELGIDAGDIGFDARHLLLEPRFLSREIDHVLERQRRDLPAHDQLHRALRRSLRKRDIGEAREAAHHLRPARS